MSEEQEISAEDIRQAILAGYPPRGAEGQDSYECITLPLELVKDIRKDLVGCSRLLALLVQTEVPFTSRMNTKMAENLKSVLRRVTQTIDTLERATNEKHLAQPPNIG